MSPWQAAETVGVLVVVMGVEAEGAAAAVVEQ